MNVYRLTILLTAFAASLASAENINTSSTNESSQPRNFQEKIGIPVERRVALYATELGNPGVKIPEGEAIMAEFLRRTVELGGKPRVTREESRSWFKYDLKQGERLEDIVVKYTKGCATFDEKCMTIIQSNNRSIEDLAKHVGPIMLPQREIRLNVMIDYGDGFRVAQVGNETTYYVKRPLEESLRSLSQMAWWTPDVSSFWIGNQKHFVKLVIEDECQ